MGGVGPVEARNGHGIRTRPPVTGHGHGPSRFREPASASDSASASGSATAAASIGTCSATHSEQGTFRLANSLKVTWVELGRWQRETVTVSGHGPRSPGLGHGPRRFREPATASGSATAAASIGTSSATHSEQGTFRLANSLKVTWVELGRWKRETVTVSGHGPRSPGTATDHAASENQRLRQRQVQRQQQPPSDRAARHTPSRGPFDSQARSR
jgi:hypothetical protein